MPFVPPAAAALGTCSLVHDSPDAPRSLSRVPVDGPLRGGAHRNGVRAVGAPPRATQRSAEARRLDGYVFAAFSILAQESRNDTARLNTGRPGAESAVSAQK